MRTATPIIRAWAGKIHALLPQKATIKSPSIGLILACLILSPASHAYTQQLAYYLSTYQTQKAYQLLLAQQQDQANNPEFNDWLSQLALQLNDYPQAINALERLILLQPEHLGARLDLAIAYYKTGDPASAQQELGQLKQKMHGLADAPPKIQQAIRLLQHQLRYRNRYKTSTLLQLGTGYDSNINQGAADATIPLNLDGQLNTSLELSPHSIAQGSAFSSQRLQWQASQHGHSCPGRWCKSAVFDLSSRLHRQHSEYNPFQAVLGGTLSRKTGQRQDRISGYLQYAHLSDTDSLLALSSELSQRWKHNQQWLGYALYLNNRHTLNSTREDSQQSSFTLLGEQHNRWYYSASLGYHHQPGRASGNTLQSQLNLSYKTRLGSWHSQSQLSLNWDKDDQPYNFTLFGNTERTDTKYQLSFTASKALTPRWITSLRLEHSNNSSNIPLFNRNRTQINFTASYLW